MYDYHDADWPEAVLGLTEGDGVAVAVNAARGGESEALSAVADGGRFATITGKPPTPERGVSIAEVYARADGHHLQELAGWLAQRKVEVSVAAVHPLEHAADALALVTHGGRWRRSRTAPLAPGHIQLSAATPLIDGYRHATAAWRVPEQSMCGDLLASSADNHVVRQLPEYEQGGP